MPSSSTAYGTTSPQALDPFPIESVLAKVVAENNPDNAANLLDLYQMQRQTSEGNYNFAQKQQHEFAKQQLAQQLMESRMKYGQEAVKTRGGLSLLAAQDPGAIGSFSPDQVADIEGGLTGLQRAKTIQDLGAGLYSGVQAGTNFDPGQVRDMSGGLFTGEGTPLQLQIAAMKEQGRDRRHGDGSGSGGFMNVPYKEYINDKGEKVYGMIRVRKNSTDAELDAIKSNADRIYSRLNPRSESGVPGQTTTVPPATPPPQAPPAPPATPPRAGSTSLQRNPAAPPAATPAPGTSLGRTITDPGIQSKARVGLGYLTKQQQMDVRENTTGAILPVVKLPSGNHAYATRKGVIELPGPPK